MKRISFFLAIAMLLSLTFCFAACDDHTHEYATEWSKDEDFHWYACKSEGCTSQSEKAEHEWGKSFDGEGNEIDVCGICLYQAAQVDTSAPHDHDYADTLENNMNFHWNPCKVEGCLERGNRAEHDFGMPDIQMETDKITRTYICQTCAYTKTEITQISSVVDGAVSWSQAFENLTMLNFEMDVYLPEGMGNMHNHCILTEDGVYYCIPGTREFYSVKNADGSFTTYARELYYEDLDAPFYKLAVTTDIFYEMAKLETTLRLSFADYYENFTYDAETGAYVYAGEIEATAYGPDGEPYPSGMMCYNNEVKVADGKITHISADYYFGDVDEDMRAKFVYSNIGLSEVIVPKEIIENAVFDPDYVFEYGNDMGPDAEPEIPDGWGEGGIELPKLDQD